VSARRTVLFTTGIRSEYDILYSVMKAVESHSRLAARVVITGAHLSPMYGHTADEVSRDGFVVAGRVESLLNSDSKAGRVKSAAIQLQGLVDLLDSQRPDILVAMADREEALTVATAGAYLSIPVAHIGGGDTADDGNVDNAVRHAVTKLSHLHCVTTQKSAERVIRMGEEPWRVRVVGAPGLDRLLRVPTMTEKQVSAALGRSLPKRPFALVIQHSVIADAERAGEQMRVTLEAVLGAGLSVLVSYPNSDAGSQRIIAVIEEFATRFADRVFAYKNLARNVFANVLRSADVLVGNSSCGIIEAPLLHLATVNVGPRQVGREHAENVQFVAHDAAAIGGAIRRAIEDKEYRRRLAACENPYGDGHAGEKIADLLAETPLDDRLIYKKNTF
jgi:UDP-hydrolysing UDP-N-acetyl-D-glucosamine 2-epimerase